jgi:D-alanyl-lipoteichoic acid acyltransferase DltB (MBOAT superfamily)
MLFNSLHFLVFFPLVTIVYFSLPQRFRWILLLAASYYFYMCWKPVYTILLVVSTLIDYFAGLIMGRISERAKRRKYLILSVIANLSLLFTFKYFNFFNSSLQQLLGNFNILYQAPHLKLFLPIGISFYTFQTMSYSIDVYRGDIKPQRHLGIFALYVTFFPQLVAGPIERATNLLPQFYQKIDFDYRRVTDGLKLMAWGFFQKVVIADRLAPFVDQVYNAPKDYTGISLMIATVFFVFQVYCDFSGYCDIAIGAAQVLGIRLMQNFNRPFFAKSIQEFWRRWHISLSTWFKDYLYIPLGGNRVSKLRNCFNLLVTFFISGIWHGANWTFVVFGALHGFYLVFSIITKGLRDKINRLIGINRIPVLHNSLKTAITFSLFCFSMIFFRAKDLPEAFYIVTHLFSGLKEQFLGISVSHSYLLGQHRIDFWVAVSVIMILEAVHLLQEKGSLTDMIAAKPLSVRLLAYDFLVLAILLFGAFGSKQFIYFQF